MVKLQRATSCCILEPGFQAEVRIVQLLMGYALLPALLGLSHQSTFSSEISCAWLTKGHDKTALMGKYHVVNNL